ncbi:unnamed protein product [Cyprideis torosa]|uniref:Uncharacterized protein n=1 Tax=Cyprideis torosa TaxID=163714 RepID=A0A7R8ZP27_9CRUS|nr:unnamed protein product [Cyprideis torosa]CAG0892940.1 unnamed protein product [Cyprideis torosa]
MSSSAAPPMRGLLLKRGAKSLLASLSLAITLDSLVYYNLQYARKPVLEKALENSNDPNWDMYHAKNLVAQGHLLNEKKWGYPGLDVAKAKKSLLEN